MAPSHSGSGFCKRLELRGPRDENTTQLMLMMLPSRLLNGAQSFGQWGFASAWSWPRDEKTKSSGGLSLDWTRAYPVSESLHKDYVEYTKHSVATQYRVVSIGLLAFFWAVAISNGSERVCCRCAADV